MNVYNHWTPEDERRLIELYESGMKVKQIATHINRTLGATASRIASLSARGLLTMRGGPAPIPDTVKAKVLAAYERGDRKPDIAAALDMPFHQVVWVVHQHRKSLGLVRKQVRPTSQSTGSSALDAAVDTLRKELEVLQLQQTRIADKIVNLRRTIQHVQSISL
jgi:hypothetical protein